MWSVRGIGRGRHREHVHRLFHVLDAFLVAHAEALLLIDDEQAQVFELHIFGQQPVRADDDVDFAVLEPAQRLLLFLGRAEAAEHVRVDGKPSMRRISVL